MDWNRYNQSHPHDMHRLCQPHVCSKFKQKGKISQCSSPSSPLHTSCKGPEVLIMLLTFLDGWWLWQWGPGAYSILSPDHILQIWIHNQVRGETARSKHWTLRKSSDFHSEVFEYIHMDLCMYVYIYIHIETFMQISSYQLPTDFPGLWMNSVACFPISAETSDGWTDWEMAPLFLSAFRGKSSICGIGI